MEHQTSTNGIDSESILSHVYEQDEPQSVWIAGIKSRFIIDSRNLMMENSYQSDGRWRPPC